MRLLDPNPERACGRLFGRLLKQLHIRMCMSLKRTESTSSLVIDPHDINGQVL